MTSEEIARAFASLTTPAVADACLRLGLPLRVAPQGLKPLVPGWRAAGRVLPARHVGSVDVFLEAYGQARPGDVLVIDNAGRCDEACIGDLTAIEARAAGLSGMVVWGSHRDTAELLAVGLPVFSYGALPAGPRRLDPRPPDALTSARFGEVVAGREDAVFADDDGAVFVEAARVAEALSAAEQIATTERAQAQAVAGGRTLREQFAFDDYIARRAADPAYGLRDHLRRLGGAIEV